MTEQTGFPPDPNAVVFPPAAPAAPVPADAAQAEAGAQLAAQAAATPTGDAAQVDEATRNQIAREVLLPMEQQITDLMAEVRQQQAANNAEIALLRQQLAAAQAQAGPPEVVTLGQAVADRIASAAASSPAGLPASHFASVKSAAEQLAQASKDAVQAGDGSKLPDMIGAIEKWIVRTHPRTSGGVVVEHFPALLDDLDRLAEAAGKLAPVAVAAAE